MPSIVSHAAIPLALGVGLGERRIPRPLLVAGIAASMLPDADVVLFRFGATYANAWSHRGFSHSLGFAIVLGAIAAAALRKSSPPLVAFAFVACSAASHGLLDMMTSGGHGVAIFWPLSDQRLFFDWRPIQVSPLDPHRWIARAGRIALSEFVWIWIPAIVVGWVLRHWRADQGTSA